MCNVIIHFEGNLFGFYAGRHSSWTDRLNKFHFKIPVIFNIPRFSGSHISQFGWNAIVHAVELTRTIPTKK